MEKSFSIEDIESLATGVSSFSPDEELGLAHLGNGLSEVHKVLGEGSWIGFYLPKKRGLLLGAFQGTPACEVIAYGKGVVGESYAKDATVIVEDVTKHPGYICCDSAAMSEICVPIHKDGSIIAILDIDLPYRHDFTEEIPAFEKLAAAFTKLL